ncbi:MAG: hypothetical protein NT075_20850 [Chloroflexi bacterium]|nr:hypothetical protein [Chloroflexota bacterium]
MNMSMYILGYPLLIWLVLLAVGAICGAIGQAFAGYSPGGCLIALVVGFIGAWFGVWLAGSLGLPPIFTLELAGQTFLLIWAIIGALLFAIVLGLVLQRIIVDA